MSASNCSPNCKVAKQCNSTALFLLWFVKVIIPFIFPAKSIHYGKLLHFSQLTTAPGLITKVMPEGAISANSAIASSLLSSTPPSSPEPLPLSSPL